MTIMFDNNDGKVASPCINVCKMNDRTAWCEGCFRTIEEIVQWGTATEPFKRKVWQEIGLRQACTK